MKEIIGKKVGAIEVLSTFGVMIAALGGAWTSEVYRRPSHHGARPQRVLPENVRTEVGEGEFGGMQTIIIIPGGAWASASFLFGIGLLRFDRWF